MILFIHCQAGKDSLCLRVAGRERLLHIKAARIAFHLQGQFQQGLRHDVVNNEKMLADGFQPATIGLQFRRRRDIGRDSASEVAFIELDELLFMSPFFAHQFFQKQRHIPIVGHEANRTIVETMCIILFYGNRQLKRLLSLGRIWNHLRTTSSVLFVAR